MGGDTNFLITAGNHGSLAVSPNSSVPVIVTNLDGTTFTNYVGSFGVIWYSLPAPTTNDLTAACIYSNERDGRRQIPKVGEPQSNNRPLTGLAR